jgi:hypothetical protein
MSSQCLDVAAASVTVLAQCKMKYGETSILLHCAVATLAGKIVRTTMSSNKSLNIVGI